MARDADLPAVEPGLPRWVERLLAPEAISWSEIGGLRCRTRRGRDFCLASVRLPAAVELSATALETRSADLYRLLARVLAKQPAAHPVRLWNYIPGILSPLDGEGHRYMVFNAGRFTAMEEWLGSYERFPRGIATASGVGHDGGDLVVHCLAAPVPGEGVENPRQIPAYRYSRRYGRRPPSFARATRLALGEGPWLLVGGTASVLGEDSAHLGDLAAQLGETLRNLGALVESACRANGADPLSRFRELRVYYVRSRDLGEISATLRERFSGAIEIEFVRAELCRPELLVEIEGVVELP